MDRKQLVLAAIIEAYINTWAPVWSKYLMEISEFDVSTATLRKEMNRLEKENLLMQPHTSSWRVPTTKWYKEYLKTLLEIPNDRKHDIKKKFEAFKDKYNLTLARQRVRDGLHVASWETQNLAFATIPWNDKSIYLGLSNIIRQPEFAFDWTSARVIDVFECWLISKLEEIKISDCKVNIFVWEENIFEQFNSCTLLAIQYKIFNFSWVLGILWPMRMDYAYNIAILEETKAFIEGESYVKKLKSN